MDAASMMLALFMFFFTLPVLGMIAKFTNAKAGEVVHKVRHTDEDGHVHTKVPSLLSSSLGLGNSVTVTTCAHACTRVTRHTHHTQVVKNVQPNSFRERRAKDWKPLSAGELLVWIGITIRMGTLGRARASHYWCRVDGLHDETIGSTMLKNRYNAITSNLSFAPRGTGSGWAKISWLDGVLRKACRAACGITQHVAVDESMIKCLSKYCPWLQYMPKKPIKRGVYPYTHANTQCKLYPLTHYPNFIHCTTCRYQSVLFGFKHWFPV